jgi:MHS family proline/betaine transporter-like MFS transporter
MIGDRKGRKSALILTIFVQAVGTAATGLLPSYQAVGLIAPVGLVIARLIQGFAIGGEWGTSIVYMVESAPERRRGFYGSLQQATIIGGLLIGSGAASLLTSVLDPEALEDWGWRVPFLVGGVLAPVGVYMRRHTEETASFLRQNQRGQTAAQRVPMVTALQAVGISIAWSVMTYVFLVYMPTFMTQYAGVGDAAALWSNTVGLFLLMVAIPCCGLLSDRVGRKPLLITSCIAIIIAALPLFTRVLVERSIGFVLLTQLLLALLIALYLGVAPATIAELFGTGRRSTYLSTTNALATAIFGGFAPFIATWLIQETGISIAPIYYVIVAVTASAFVILTIKETAYDELR